MRALALCLASLSFSASAQPIHGAPSATESSIVVVQNGSEAGAPLVADAVDSVTIAIAIRDDAGEPIADLPIRIDVTGSRNIVTPASISFTDANGLFARDGQANEVTLTARDFFGNVAAQYRVTIQQTAAEH